MIIGFAQELPDSPKASFTLGKQTYTREFHVYTDSPLDGPATVCFAIGIPPLYSPYQFGLELQPFAFCRDLEAERVAGPVSDGLYLWKVTATYETPDPSTGSLPDGGSAGGSGGNADGRQGDGGGTQQENPAAYSQPELAYPEVQYHFETKEVPIWYYIVSGTVASPTTIAPVTASNGEIFNPPPHRDESRIILQITRNESILAPHPALGVAFMDTINSDVFWGAPAGTCRCTAITAMRQQKQYPDGRVYPYLRATYTFKFKPSWNIYLLDKGTYYKESTNPAKPKTPFLDNSGNPTEGLLDGFGGKLADGGTPQWRYVTPYGSRPFSVLNLPQAFTDYIA